MLSRYCDWKEGSYNFNNEFKISNSKFEEIVMVF